MKASSAVKAMARMRAAKMQYHMLRNWSAKGLKQSSK